MSITTTPLQTPCLTCKHLRRIHTEGGKVSYHCREVRSSGELVGKCAAYKGAK